MPPYRELGKGTSRTAGLEVLFEDNHVIAVFKPAGRLIQGDATGEESLIETTKHWLKEKYGKPGNVFLGLVHRLDRPVSGVVVFGKTSKGASRLSEQFRGREVRKHYHALVEGRPEAGEKTLTQYVERDETRGVTVVHQTERPGTKRASLSYTVKETRGEVSLLEVLLHTGRKHQIRAQLASAGYPILGDRKYGARHPFDDGNIALVAKRIEFHHPVRAEETIVVEVPERLCPLRGWR